MTDEFDDEWDAFEKEVTVTQKNNVESIEDYTESINAKHLQTRELEIESDNKLTKDMFSSEFIEGENNYQMDISHAIQKILPNNNKKNKEKRPDTKNNIQKINVIGKNKPTIGNKYYINKKNKIIDEDGEDDDNDEELDYSCYIHDKLTR